LRESATIRSIDPTFLHESLQLMTNTTSLRYAIGGDHAGFVLKNDVLKLLLANSVNVIDCGTYTGESCDFPDFAEIVAKKILSGEVDRGILVCGSGVGVSVAANKFPGIRASLCHDTYSARQGVEHDDMNILCIGSRVIGPESAFEVIRSFLGARYSPAPRHAARLAKIVEIERRVLAGEFSKGEHQS
jgi:ribose 5-phosphate isomerase B